MAQNVSVGDLVAFWSPADRKRVIGKVTGLTGDAATISSGGSSYYQATGSLTDFTSPQSRSGITQAPPIVQGAPEQQPANIFNEQVSTAKTMFGVTEVTTEGLVPSGDQTGNTDTNAIQGLLSAANAGSCVVLAPGTFYINSSLTIPSGVGLVSLYGNQSFGIPIANYGVGGLNLQGTILYMVNGFANPNSATGCLVLNQATGQGGSMRLQNISLDCSNLPNGNNLHGILIQNNVACITMRDVTVYGGTRQLGGDTLHGVASTGQPPDLLDIAFCHFSGGTGGVTLSGVADSYFTSVESTANGNYAWNIINCNNTRFLGCKGETSTAGPGWLFTANAGFTGVVHLALCTSQANFGDGFKFTGSGTGTYHMIACSDDGSGVNGGSGGGSYSGLNVTSFSGIVEATGWNTRVSTTTTSPQYGVSMTSSNTLILTPGNVAGQTQAFNNGGGNTSFIGPTPPGGFLCTPTSYSTTATFTTSSTTYAAVSSSNVNTGAFIAPPSGSVFVQATFIVTEATGATVVGFALATHDSVTPIGNPWQVTLANNAVNMPVTVPFLVTNLTPGTSYTLDLLFACTTNTLTIKSQAFSGTSLTSSTEGGPILMTVQAI